MSSQPPSTPASWPAPAEARSAPRKGDETLPPVQPPNAGFIVQLFFIPLLIVSIIVCIWLMFSWIAHAGNNPRHLVVELRKNNDASWQKAFELANLLRNSETESLKDDIALATDLSDFLDAEISLAAKAEHKVKLRLFLCRVLGEFRVEEVLPVLIRAAKTQRDITDIDVRTAAVEALAIFVHNRGAERVTRRDEIAAAVLEASRTTTDNETDRRLCDELRSRAAFALGVIGGELSLSRLEQLRDDSYPNVRFNAASGLARHGDPRAISGLLEMLDPNNVALSRDEVSDSEKARKRTWVLSNGIKATQRFFDSHGERSPELVDAIEKLSTADVPEMIRLDALNLLYSLRSGS